MIGEFFVIREKLKKLIRSVFTNKSDRVLDIGCGNDPYYHKLIKGKLVCFDIKQYNKVHVIGNADFLPFRKDSFDDVIFVNSLYYCSNPFKVIENVSRVLKDKGTLLIITPFIYPIHDAPFDKYRFTEYGIRELLKEDFNIKEIKAVGGIFNLPAVFFHSLIKGVPLMTPKSIRKLVALLSIILFYPFYFIAQIISILDFLDISGRWATYYFVLAVKK
jgi:SAM-dependent methyltransferase